MSTLIVTWLLLVVASAACLTYLIPTVAGWISPRVFRRPHPQLTFAILIPANDEEASLPATLAALDRLDYPADMLRVYVVADNCADRTAEVAALSGALCLIRNDADRRGKGFALEFGLEAVLADDPDAVLILDADCELNSDALRALHAVFATGADVVQAAVRSKNADDGPVGYVAAIGSAVDASVAAGLERLGFPVSLRGTGMAFRSSVLERIRWASYGAVEDAEYDARLRAAGVRVRYCSGALVTCDAPAAAKDLAVQRRRWRASLLVGGWRGLPVRLVGSKPLVLAHLVVTSAVVAAVGPEWAEYWTTGLLLATAIVYFSAVVRVGLSWRRAGLLLRAPVVIARLGWVTVAGIVLRKPGRWDQVDRSCAEEGAHAVREETDEDEAGPAPPFRPSAVARVGRSGVNVRRRPSPSALAGGPRTTPGGEGSCDVLPDRRSD